MTYEDFQQYLDKKVMYEAQYKDSEGRDILVICKADAYDMVNKAIRNEREACATVCEELIGSHAMAKHCADAIRARGEK